MGENCGRRTRGGRHEEACALAAEREGDEKETAARASRLNPVNHPTSCLGINCLQFIRGTVRRRLYKRPSARTIIRGRLPPHEYPARARTIASPIRRGCTPPSAPRVVSLIELDGELVARRRSTASLLTIRDYSRTTHLGESQFRAPVNDSRARADIRFVICILHMYPEKQKVREEKKNSSRRKVGRKRNIVRTTP